MGGTIADVAAIVLPAVAHDPEAHHVGSVALIVIGRVKGGIDVFPCQQVWKVSLILEKRNLIIQQNHEAAGPSLLPLGGDSRLI